MRKTGPLVFIGKRFKTKVKYLRNEFTVTLLKAEF
jgi:hypothetical protein